jgi:hypothetical protein
LEFKSLDISILEFRIFVVAWYLLNDVIAGQNGPNVQTSSLISDLNSKINSPGQATKELLKPDN